MNNAKHSSAGRGADSDSIPMLEWIISGLGFVLVAGSLIFLFYKASFQESIPPDIQAELRGSRAASRGYVAIVELKNTGGQTAAELQVEARLLNAPDSDVRQATIDFLPPSSVRQVEFCFQHPPTTKNLSVQLISFQIP